MYITLSPPKTALKLLDIRDVFIKFANQVFTAAGYWRRPYIYLFIIKIVLEVHDRQRRQTNKNKKNKHTTKKLSSTQSNQLDHIKSMKKNKNKIKSS